ncbi:NAD-reducing hydrogenase HoxS subunit gamma [BD1-7 clade bacterium]|uniref:NADH-quinone oxidoreductase subunit G n=1 Tax=BD1-7 clade bacterium TaxID=2029982 RepID=A0A5S9QNL6_9GAMM|nr:NAD-reducing hydrogenase HoxS subunit gamma [BD1-7 clade bacterium]
MTNQSKGNAENPGTNKGSSSSESSHSSLTIDGRELTLSGDEGESLLDVASAHGEYIPHLCYHKSLSPHGSCKLCTIKVDGKFQSACLTTAKSGQVIENHSDEITDYRQQMIELLFAEGNHFCPSCELSGNCQLQAMAYDLGITHMRFPLTYPRRRKDGSHPDIFLDRDRCINCALCVRASNEVDGKKVFGLAGRGADSYLQVNSPDGTLGSSDLSIDDLAANICPVGAISSKHNNYLQRPGQRLYDQHSISELGNQRPDFEHMNDSNIDHADTRKSDPS